ncbi:MAG: hypothetical protein ACKO1T_05590, partial [Sediminibacterium sp.]
YEHLNQYLQQADLLLVVSSFLPEYAHVTRSSVQTKLTDYMASGRPILSCGPSYGACNLFVKNWNCGIVSESNQVPVIKKILLKQIEDPSKSYTIIQNAFKVLLENFETGKVRSKLYDFIKQIKIVESQLQLRDEER